MGALVRFILHRQPVEVLFAEVHQRGWIPVPFDYAIRSWPAEVASGWWPKQGER